MGRHRFAEPVALGVVLGAPLQLVTGGGNPFSSDGTLDGWVFGMVYGGFILQAVLLPAGFVLYARQRWPEVLTGGRAFDRAGPTKQLQDVLGLVFVLGAAGFVAQQLVWTVTGGGGYADPDTAQRVFLVAGALLAAGGGVAYIGLIRGARLTPPRLVLAWLGTAVTFTSSFSETLKSVAIQRGAWGATAAGPGDTAITMLVLLSAVAGAIGGALRLRDEHRCARDPTRTAHGH